MKVGDSVRIAIDLHVRGEFEASMLHACAAIDGTAKKRFGEKRGNADRFTQLLRDHYDVLGPMGLPGINIASTRWPVKVRTPKAPGGGVDIADLIYGVHRCTEGHGDELPDGFELLSNSTGQAGVTHLMFAPGKVRLSDRIVWALLAVAVLAPENGDQQVPDGYTLSYGRNNYVMEINRWWARASDFGIVLASDPPPPLVHLDLAKMSTH